MKVGQARVVSVIGGGSSFSEVDTAKIPGARIVANDSAYYLAQIGGAWEFAVTMDRKWLEYRWEFLKDIEAPVFARDSILKGIPEREREQPWLNLFANTNDCHAPMSETPTTLNGDSSGACAINLAYCMRPKELYLFGFDMRRHPTTNDAYRHPPYPWALQGGTKDGKYSKWAQAFDHIRASFDAIGTTVWNVSSFSAITAFRRVSPRDIGVCKWK